MAYMVGGRVLRLGAFPGREGEGLGLFLGGRGTPCVARIVYLPGVDPSAREALEREVARAAEYLDHPHVQAPLGIDEVDGRLALAIEHADGETLAEILNVGGRLPVPVAARIVRDACLAIQFAHDEGGDARPILHGWLRPSNLLVSRSGLTLVSGFGVGLARSAGDLLPWQSPEQVLGGPSAASSASDVHGLGLVLHACLAGENPFEREPDPDVAILSRAAPLLEPLGVPPALAAVVRRALSVKPGERYATAAALARAVEAAVPEVAAPATVAAWSESLFPAGMGMRVLRQRAVDAAVVAAARETAHPPGPEAGPVPLPEPRATAAARRPAGPAWRRFPVPRPASAPPPFRSGRPVLGPDDDVEVPEFSLAAPPFPHPVRRPDPVEAIDVDVVMPDPPPPLRFPAPARQTLAGPQAIGRGDVRGTGSAIASAVATALAQTRN